MAPALPIGVPHCSFCSQVEALAKSPVVTAEPLQDEAEVTPSISAAAEAAETGVAEALAAEADAVAAETAAAQALETAVNPPLFSDALSEQVLPDT